MPGKIQSSLLFVLVKKLELCSHGLKCAECCWNWTGVVDRHGYGKLGYNNKAVIAHRQVYLWKYKVTLTSKQYILHNCDNRLCCNWHHLYIGDHTQNMRDRDVRNRSSKGHEHKLYASQVYQIRRLYYSGGWFMRELCNIFPVKYSVIQRIIKHHDWSHLQGELLIK
jgi:hypothetical protein